MEIPNVVTIIGIILALALAGYGIYRNQQIKKRNKNL